MAAPAPRVVTPSAEEEAANDAKVAQFFDALQKSVAGLPWYEWERELLVECLTEAHQKNGGPALFMYDFHEVFHHRVVAAESGIDRSKPVGVVFDILLYLFRETPRRPTNMDPAGNPCDPDFWRRRFLYMLNVLLAVQTPGYAAPELGAAVAETDGAALLKRLAAQTAFEWKESLEERARLTGS